MLFATPTERVIPRKRIEFAIDVSLARPSDGLIPVPIYRFRVPPVSPRRVHHLRRIRSRYRTLRAHQNTRSNVEPSALRRPSGNEHCETNRATIYCSRAPGCVFVLTRVLRSRGFTAPKAAIRARKGRIPPQSAPARDFISRPVRFCVTRGDAADLQPAERKQWQIEKWAPDKRAGEVLKASQNKARPVLSAWRLDAKTRIKTGRL